MTLPPEPAVYEINTAVWLERLGRGRGSPLRLEEVPAGEWDRLAALPVDAVWLMGVWRRSPAGLQIALANPEIEAANRAALPDLRSEDVIGSPYCVREYRVDGMFGGDAGLAAARRQLDSRGLGLILDYVPNHIAPDHPWVVARPECLLPGTEAELVEHPEAFIHTAGGVFANGRDPYFPPWPDVVQLNAFSPVLRAAVRETLNAIAGMCDGVRCDMAMLMTNEVFERTWASRAGAPPAEEFWPGLILAVKAAHPGFQFLAEAYWDMEWDLQQQGFDYCYDKRLYDRLAHEPAASVRGHLQADADYQRKLVRFIENHDEPRAAATFGPGQARAAAVVMSAVRGARLFHDGQLEGRRVRIPVFLRRGPDEAPDQELRAFYGRLLGGIAAAPPHEGSWQPCECTGWPDNDSARNLVAWCWGGASLVVVNLSDVPAQGRVHLPWPDLAGRMLTLQDRLGGESFERAGDEIAAQGLYVDVEAWGSYFFAVS